MYLVDSRCHLISAGSSACTHLTDSCVN